METPKIGERVKFWQEQDRINRELIPRLIKSHELLTRHVETHDEGNMSAMSEIQALQSHILELEERSAGFVGRIVPYIGLATAVIALILALAN